MRRTRGRLRRRRSLSRKGRKEERRNGVCEKMVSPSRHPPFDFSFSKQLADSFLPLYQLPRSMDGNKKKVSTRFQVSGCSFLGFSISLRFVSLGSLLAPSLQYSFRFVSLFTYRSWPSLLCVSLYFREGGETRREEGEEATQSDETRKTRRNFHLSAFLPLTFCDMLHR